MEHPILRGRYPMAHYRVKILEKGLPFWVLMYQVLKYPKTCLASSGRESCINFVLYNQNNIKIFVCDSSGCYRHSR